MSLNKFTDVQKGIDLNLNIGCFEAEAKSEITTPLVTSDRVINSQFIDTNELRTNSLLLDGVPLEQPKNITQGQAIATKPISNTTAETSMVPASVVGSMAFPANSLVVGDVIEVHSRGIISSNLVANTLNVKLYTDATGSTLTADSGAQSFGPAILNESYHVEGTIVITSANTLRFSGWMTITDFATKTPKVFQIGQQSSVVDLSINNNFTYTFQWGTANSQATIIVYTYEVKKASVKPV